MIAALIAAGLTAGCSASAAISGNLDSGEPFTGVASGGLSGGTVRIELPDGRVCRGEYDAFSHSPELSVPLDCLRGLTGLAQVSRSDDFQSGAGTFELSNGKTGTFTYALK